MQKKQFVWLGLLFTASCAIFMVLFFTVRVLVGLNNAGWVFKTNLENSEISNERKVAGIPGLNREEVNLHLSKQGYECTEPETGDDSLQHWVCWKKEDNVLFEIYFFSSDQDGIDFIDANINQPINPSDQIAIEFLIFVGSLPDHDAEALVIDWISVTLPSINQARDIREKKFSGITYRLYGISEARSLEVGTLPWVD